MRKKAQTEDKRRERDRPEVSLPEQDNGENEEYKVTDRRHWTLDATDDADEVVAVEPAKPTIIDEYRERAEAAEQKLQEYIEAFKQFRDEQDQFRKRLNRDVDHKVDLKFGGVVAELLETVDNLDLAVTHANQSAGVDALVQGIELARDRFQATLERAGVEKIEPQGQPFDPEESEAMRVDPVNAPEQDGTITETLRPGYRIRECLIRPARVAVGRLQKRD